MDLTVLQHRALIYKKIRAFFDQQSMLEVDTPLLARATNTDPHIQSIQASACASIGYLQTSPEFAMKRLLAAGSGSIYQICHAFRDEEKGAQHHPEFSLLEWYRLDFDYQDLMVQVEELLNVLFGQDLVFQKTSYFESFHDQLNLDLQSTCLADYQQCVSAHIDGIDSSQLTRDNCLDLLMSQIVAKRFKGFTFVYDYPASQASLARLKQGFPHLAERFELFYNDLELANGFSELTDAEQQRSRFQQDNHKRQQFGLQTYPIDECFLQALENGLPECAGVAVGLDRILMIMQQFDSIRQVMTLDTL